jgi:hypothetical protein
VAGWPAHVTKSSPICPQGAVVEIKRNILEGKEGKRRGRWPAGHRYLAGWPHLASTQLPLSFFTTSFSSHAPLTKSIKSKVNSLHLFPKFYLFLFEIFRFYDMQ